MNTIKQFTLLCCILISSVISLHAAAPAKHLFILSGQSNMAGLDPKISFTPAVQSAFGKENVTIVLDAQGGQPIRRWYKEWKPAPGREVVNRKTMTNGDLYQRLIKKVKQATQGQEYNTVTFLWMQGERDAKESHGEVYAKSLLGIINQLKKDLNKKDLNFVIGRLSDYDLENKIGPHWTMVRNAQVQVAESSPSGAWVNTDDLNDGLSKNGKMYKNDLHYSVEGYKEFGKRLAGEAIALIESKGFSANKEQAKKASNHPVIRLWPIEQIGGQTNYLKEESEDRGEGKTTFRNIKDPHLVVSQVSSDTPTPAVIYSPGGSYKQVSPVQGYIDWLNSLGFTVFTLKYTVPNDREAAYRDIQRAIRLVRHNAKKWNIDPKQLGLVGTSAGGHLSARLSQNYTESAYAPIDQADSQSCEPQFVLLRSAAYLAKKNKGSTIAEEFHFNNKVPPTLLLYSKDDHNFVKGGIAYAEALEEASFPVKLLLYEKGGHSMQGVNWHSDAQSWIDTLGLDLN
ncbi:sialate O-acetylesterase [Rubritalea spongiae]|uniref:Sialate O-acetylesterase n=1 Tax=Rubritalea spongiae TaxID=430797 RepID=A0ABW5E2I5_9BACT